MLPDGQSDFAGVKLRNKFAATKHEGSWWQFGANFEVSYIPHRFEDSLFAGEIRPILGYSELTNSADVWVFKTILGHTL